MSSLVFVPHTADNQTISPREQSDLATNTGAPEDSSEVAARWRASLFGGVTYVDPCNAFSERTCWGCPLERCRRQPHTSYD